MNIQQFEYIIAVDNYRSFAKAAEACFITQSTLSLMIQRLEEELSVYIFDRSRQPVVPTEVGKGIIEKAKTIVKEIADLRETASSFREEIKGEIKLGIIPTVAPYILPVFLKSFLIKYPGLKFKISEMTTDTIIEKLEKNILDVGILASPVKSNTLNEQHLYNEELVVYASPGESVLSKKVLIPNDINADHLWLLEEGHCLRSQILNICEMRKKDLRSGILEYNAGSIDSLIKLVDQNEGITILPELAVLYMSPKQKTCIRHFKAPVPVREICLAVNKHFVKARILNVLCREITDNIQELLARNAKQKIIER